jgi:hypothetical protein
LPGVETGVATGVGDDVGVGFTVGVAVGFGLGVAVGATVGIVVGATVGVAVGCTVGVGVGLAVAAGVALGAEVGMAVAPDVGTAVGALVGCAVSVGAAVGAAVAVAAEVGIAVALAVGVAEAPSSGVDVGLGPTRGTPVPEHEQSSAVKPKMLRPIPRMCTAASSSRTVPLTPRGHSLAPNGDEKMTTNATAPARNLIPNIGQRDEESLQYPVKNPREERYPACMSEPFHDTKDSRLGLLARLRELVSPPATQRPTESTFAA